MDRGLIKTSDVLTTLGHQNVNDAQLGHLLMAQDLICERDLFETLAAQQKLPFLETRTSIADQSLQDGLAPHQCLQLQCVPWHRDAYGTTLASSTPERFDEAIKLMPAHLHPIHRAIASPSDINELIQSKGEALLVARAETLVPEALSCRQLPAQLKTLLVALCLFAIIAFSLRWVSLAGLYRAFFGFAVAMVFTGMLIKTAAVLIQVFSLKPERQKRSPLPQKLPKLTILIPLHDESEILDTLLQRIGLLNYPKALLDVILVIEASDKATRTHLNDAILSNWMRTLIVPPGNITTKPRAMNYALPFCKGDIVGIYDAEDAPHPEQLNEVAARFAAEPNKTACLQGVLGF